MTRRAVLIRDRKIASYDDLAHDRATILYTGSPARVLVWQRVSVSMATHSKVSTIEKSPFVAKVSFLQVDRAGETLASPDGTWDLVFIRNAQSVRAIRTGLTTRPVRLWHSEGEEVLAISFKPSVNMATVDAIASLDKGYVLKSDRKGFRVAGEVFEIPAFNNADVFVDRLARAGLLRANRAVQSILDGQRVAMSERTLQRQFKVTTGMTYKRFTMIERAGLAAERLRKGESAQNVVHALGFYDQAHLINSVREIIGQTPSQLDRHGTLRSELAGGVAVFSNTRITATF